MDAKQESHLFLYPKEDTKLGPLPIAVYIKIPGLGSVPCKIERMDEAEISSLHPVNE